MAAGEPGGKISDEETELQQPPGTSSTIPEEDESSQVRQQAHSRRSARYKTGDGNEGSSQAKRGVGERLASVLGKEQALLSSGSPGPRKRGRPRKDPDKNVSKVGGPAQPGEVLPLREKLGKISEAGSSDVSAGDRGKDVVAGDVPSELQQQLGKTEGQPPSDLPGDRIPGLREQQGKTVAAAAPSGELSVGAPSKDQNAMFSPRRSGRGVVPNRRFQDMELNYGRKRTRDESDSPAEATGKKLEKHATTPASKRQGKQRRKDKDDQARQILSFVEDNIVMDTESSALVKGSAPSMQETEAAVGLGTAVLSVSQQATVSTSAVDSVLYGSCLSSPAAIESSPVTMIVDSIEPFPKEHTDTVMLSERLSSEDVAHIAEKTSSSGQTPSVPKMSWEGKAAQQVQKTFSVVVSSPVASSGGSTSVAGGEATSQLTVVASGKGKVMAVQSPGKIVGKTVQMGSSAVTGSPAKILAHRQLSAITSQDVGRTGEGSKDSDSSVAEISQRKTAPVGPQEVMSYVELSPNKTVPVIIGERRENVMSSSVKVMNIVPPLATQPSDTPQPPTFQDLDWSSSADLSVTSQSSLTQQVSSPASSQESSTVIEIPSIPGSPVTSSASKESLSSVDMSQPQVSVKQIIVVRKPSGEPPQNVTRYTEAEMQLATPQQGKGAKNLLMEIKEPYVPTQTKESSVKTPDLDSSHDSDVDAEDVRDGKFATSGTQTPYHRKSQDGQRLITVRVQPPSQPGQPSAPSAPTAMTVAVVKTETEPETDNNNLPAHAEGSVAVRQAASGVKSELEYVFVGIPEGSTVKQQYVPQKDRLEDDPSFYTMDEQGMYHCHICDYRTDRKPNFYKHKRKHLGVRPHKCDICNYRAATSSNLKRHLAIHSDVRNYHCHLCNLNFRQKIHLERHIKYKHEEKKVKCPLCDYVCANQNPDLKVHIRRKHARHSGMEEGKDAFTCQECGLVAMSKRDLRQHAKFHSKGPELKLFCQMCSFVTDCESRLRRHQYIHTKEKPFQCGLCDYRGSQKEHVLRHMRSQHNIEISRKQRVKKESQPGRKAAGEEGSTRVVERADYTSEEKIFACNHCTMKFAKLINLYKHLHTQHRDIMPSETGDYACVVCDFHTSSKKNLLVHMRKHNITDQCPPSHVYSCVLCHYMNPKRRNLFQHMRKKHHIEIVLRDDGTTVCCVANEALSLPGTSGVPGVSLSSGNDANIAINMMSLNDVITTVAQPLPPELQVSAPNTSSVPNIMKMEDLAMVVSNPNSLVGSEGCVVVDHTSMEGLSVESLSQNDAAEAIQGLQALAERGGLESTPVVEEQVQVMGADEQATLVIDPNAMGVVQRLVQPKAEPLEVVEIDENQLLNDVNSSASANMSDDDDASILDTAEPSAMLAEDSGLQLSAEQLMNLATGDYIEINGEMYKVEVSSQDGPGGQQVISIEPASLSEMKQQAERDAAPPTADSS